MNTINEEYDFSQNWTNLVSYPASSTRDLVTRLGGGAAKPREEGGSSASPVSRLGSRAWSFACLGRFARWTKKKERLLGV